MNNEFRYHQILLFIHHCDAFKDENEVYKIIEDIGFTEDIYFNGHKTRPLKNLYSGLFRSNNVDNLLVSLKNKIFKGCALHGFGVLDFMLIDATNTSMYRALWHDGYY